ncbi:MAG: VWA domain-containing protein [Anaerolineae bacterium]|nr:VWA domain-containing protein [Anaerolineae bacterium]
MRFASPLALLLLLAVPYFVWLGWPRLAHRRRRDSLSLALRLLIVGLLILGLAGLQTVQAADRLAVIFLVDASDSIDAAAREQATAYIRDALQSMTPNDRAGIVVFGRNALVERPASVVDAFEGIASTPVGLETNLAEAIRLGMAMFPPDSARRLVILSDGAQTLGNAMEAARLAAATNVQIDVVPLRRDPGAEMLVNDVRLPASVNEGEVFDLGVTVESTMAGVANLTILSGGAVLETRTVELQTGENDFVLSLRAPRQGFTDFQVRVDPVGSEDTYYQNNELAGFTEVTGPPRILLISANSDEVAALQPALEGAGLTIDVAAPGDLPIGLAPLAAYKAVVLANVPATALTEQRMRVLQTYVRDLGGGLVVIGGPDSYGVGGYYQTPLEDVLPVDIQIKDQRRIPRLTMVYAIDRSGSMEIVGPSGVTNLELAKEAARRSINFLYERDRAGVISFDSSPQWLVPIQYVANRDSMVDQIGALRPGGGTDIFSAVTEIARTLPADPSTLRHVILLTDGGSSPVGVVETVRQMHDEHGITLSVIAIGQNSPGFLAESAAAGHGTYYSLADVQSIPQVFAAETVLATRTYIVEEEFAPVVTANSPILRGIVSVPSLRGYVATSAKETATIVLTAPVGGYNDPLLASWQYGLGRVVAWTSDATTRWAQDWTTWQDFQRFWSQAIRSTIVEGAGNALEARVEQRDGRSVLVVEARDEDGGYINGLNLDASVIDPRLEAQNVRLRQIAPGRYEADFEPRSQGAYFIRVAGASGGESGSGTVAAAQTAGWVLSYSPEYQLRDTDEALLDRMAEITGGRNVAAAPPGDVFRHDIREERASTALWPYLLLLAVLLLPVDIAVRRVIITRSDLARLRAWLRHKLGLRDPELQPATSTRIAALKDAKQRATGPAAAAVDALRATSAKAREPGAPDDDGSPPQPRAEPTPQVTYAEPELRDEPEPEPPLAAGSLASRLAERRRQRKE